MKTSRIIALVLILALIIVGIVLFVFKGFSSKGAGLLVESVPISAVFINGEQVGRTPYEGTLKAEEVTIKLVPESAEPLAPYETKVVLVSGVKTVVRRVFGESDETAAGEVLSFEKTGTDNASLSVVSTPDAAQMSLDGQVKGFTPLKISNLSAGEHQLALTAEGYSDRVFTIKLVDGYRLTAVVGLAINPEAVDQENEEKPEEPKEDEVEILSTPTGFLRVRAEASTLGEEVGRVTPGERYKLLETDSETGWFKIELKEAEEGEDAETGWISAQYATASATTEP